MMLWHFGAISHIPCIGLSLVFLYDLVDAFTYLTGFILFFVVDIHCVKSNLIQKYVY